MNPISFVYNGEPYSFYYDPTWMITKPNSVKTLFFGQFKDKAPGTLTVGTTYCLKEIKAENPCDEGCAALRECYDLIDYQGSHLRRILAINDEASEAVRELKAGNTCKTRTHCMVIEPCYKSLKPYFQNCSNYSVQDRLDVVKQFAEGSRELGSDANRIGGRSIMAHRDLKWENGVQDPDESGIRIRLVDFATIWLENTYSTRTQIRHGGTKTLALSPENTSPESVMRTYSVSEKTDVYALGMMLASLFVRHDGSYVNPSECWCQKYGWGNHQETPTLCEQMKRCLNTYDRQPASETWIERDLREAHNISLTWEPTQDPQVTVMIRKLFYNATRIDPAQRIDRDTFIRELDKIICRANLPQDSLERQPVSVYLFDLAGIETYQGHYLEAALRVFRKERDEALSDGTEAPQALCVSFRSPPPGGKRSECPQLLAPYPCNNEQELAYDINRLRPAKPADTSLLLYAIYRAYEYLGHHTKEYRFTGNVHLFCPTIPLESALVPLSSAKRDYDLEALLDITLGYLLQGQPYLNAYTAKAPDGQEQDWCDYELFEMPQPETEQVPPPHPGVAYCDGRAFDVSDTALYVPMPNGERLYVGMIKK